jgi:hypothetical protein
VLAERLDRRDAIAAQPRERVAVRREAALRVQSDEKREREAGGGDRRNRGEQAARAQRFLANTIGSASASASSA